jgi:hypothetical protein
MCDPEFIKAVALPLFDALRTYYFRAEIDGAQNVPREGPFIAIANHNGGPLMPDCWVLVSDWWSDRVATLTLSRPDRLNALSDAMIDAAVAVLRRCAAHLRPVVRTPSGGRRRRRSTGRAAAPRPMSPPLPPAGPRSPS